jgi:hypothetical protein
MSGERHLYVEGTDGVARAQGTAAGECVARRGGLWVGIS